MSQEYDNTNSGVIFQPHEDQKFVGQGKVNIEGQDQKLVMVFERLSRDGDPVLVLYRRCGVLFGNDKKGNEKAPDNSGPLDDFPDYRIAGWKGERDGRKYMSLKASKKEGGSSPSPQGDGWDAPAAAVADDDIPF